MPVDQATQREETAAVTMPFGEERRRAIVTAAVSLLLLVAAVVILPLIGSSQIGLARALAGQSPDAEILFQVRIPRVLLALLTGGALAVAGVLFQALLRDSLATPYTLGVSSGASLGAVIAICFGFAHLWPSAIAGAGITLLVVLGVAQEARRLSSFTLLMAGVTLNSIAMALILFLHSMATFGQSFAITRWLMGGIEPAEPTTLALVAAIVLVGALLVMASARQWNLLAVGEEWAAMRGVAVTPLMLRGYVLASVLTGVVTALSGPIGFVGLIIPHALRMSAGADHRIVLPCSFLLGAVLLGICDTIARTALAPAEIPVGVITALLGGPFFLLLLRSRSRQ
jgi:iron complex transport system permease protein